jgi:uncharacterized integral membrane protein
MNWRRRLAAVAVALFCASPPSFAGTAEAAPGARRPEWVIWAALAVLILLLILIVMNQGGLRRKGRGGGHPYL